MFSLHKEWMMEDLRTLEADRNEVDKLSSELKDLEIEFTSLKATNIEKLPSHNGGNAWQEKIEGNIAKRESVQLQLNAKKSHVDLLENLLNELSDDDRKIIDYMVIRHSKTAAQLADELYFDVRTIHNRKNEAIEQLLHLRFGRGYRP